MKLKRYNFTFYKKKITHSGDFHVSSIHRMLDLSNPFSPPSPSSLAFLFPFFLPSFSSFFFLLPIPFIPSCISLQLEWENPIKRTQIFKVSLICGFKLLSYVSTTINMTTKVKYLVNGQGQVETWCKKNSQQSTRTTPAKIPGYCRYVTWTEELRHQTSHIIFDL